MGYFKNLMILNQDNQNNPEKEEKPLPQEPDELLQAFKAMKSLLLSVKNMKIPNSEVMLKNGNISLFASKKEIVEQNAEQLEMVLKQQALAKQTFHHLQEKRKLKSQDRDFIESVYYYGFESEPMLESLTDKFNKNRKQYPYLDMVMPKREVQSFELYDFAVNTMTRGYSPQRKEEKLAFQNAKAMLKRLNEQVAILKGKKTQSVKALQESLEDKLNEFFYIQSKIEELGYARSEVFLPKQMLAAYFARNEKTLQVNIDQVWNISSAQDLYLAVTNPILNTKENREEIATQTNEETKEVSDQIEKTKIVEPVIKTVEAKKEKVTQLTFVLDDGEDYGKIVEKPSKKAKDHERA